MKPKISIDDYLKKLEKFAGSDYGKMIRTQFNDLQGSGDLAMLASPTVEELAELKKAVAIMTPEEKDSADRLTDEQIQKIAADALVDPANFAIFMNGYSLHCKRIS
jgi:hypothetical protein